MTLAIHLDDPPDGCRSPLRDLDGSYVNGPFTPAVLDLARYGSFDAYQRDVLKKQKGVWSDITRARRRTCDVREYAHRAFLDDVVAIDRSKTVRCGGPMRPNYLRTLEERGGVDRTATIVPPTCPMHWRRTWGVFMVFLEGGRPGVTIECHELSIAGIPEPTHYVEHLVAYASIHRASSLAILSQWIGHGKYLRDGIMHLLFAEVVEMLYAEGVSLVMYGGALDGGAGLQRWKKRLGFEAIRLEAKR